MWKKNWFRTFVNHCATTLGLCSVQQEIRVQLFMARRKKAIWLIDFIIKATMQACSIGLSTDTKAAPFYCCQNNWTSESLLPPVTDVCHLAKWQKKINQNLNFKLLQKFSIALVSGTRLRHQLTVINVSCKQENIIRKTHSFSAFECFADMVKTRSTFSLSHCYLVTEKKYTLH